MDKNVDDVAEQSGVALYRICQEAILNIIRHAKATKATVRLERASDQMLVSIEDNGIGFFVPDDSLKQVAHKHYRLIGMKERAEAVGGALQITFQPGAGTKIVAKIPFKLHEVILC